MRYSQSWRGNGNRPSSINNLRPAFTSFTMRSTNDYNAVCLTVEQTHLAPASCMLTLHLFSLVLLLMTTDVDQRKGQGKLGALAWDILLLWTPVALYSARKPTVAFMPRKPRIARRSCSVKRRWCRPIRWLLILTGRVHLKSQKGQFRGSSCLSAMCRLCSWRREYFFSQPLWVHCHSLERLLLCLTLCAAQLFRTWRGPVDPTAPAISFQRR